MPPAPIHSLLLSGTLALTCLVAPVAVADAHEPPSIVFAAREAAPGGATASAKPAAARVPQTGAGISDLFPQSRFSQVAVVLLFASLALGALWFAIPAPQSANEEGTSSEQRVARRSDGDLLEALIANALPVVEEPLIFPALAKIHGRPVENPRHRIEPGEPLAGPHFTPVADGVGLASPSRPFRMVISRIDRPAGQPRGPSSLERVLAAVDRGLS